MATKVSPYFLSLEGVKSQSLESQHEEKGRGQKLNQALFCFCDGYTMVIVKANVGPCMFGQEVRTKKYRPRRTRGARTRTNLVLA